jgi:uncharacterized zinc-type alcohol dehydrogenase-like protein
MTRANAYAAFDPKSPFKPFPIERREPGPKDVEIDILFCGVCHSDLHTARGEWGSTQYPVVPGHEIVGRVTRVGPEVKKLRAGDTAGVGCFVGSCGKCAACRAGLEQYCELTPVFTYDATDRDGTRTYGGYSTRIVVDERFVLTVDPKQRLEAVAPLLCAGITTWSPLRHWKVGKGSRVAVQGLGGLGHMAVKLASALGAEVTLLSSSPSKKADAKRLGAQEFLLASDSAALGKAAGRFDLVLDTVSAAHDVNALTQLLKLDGTLVLVGAPPTPHQVAAFPLIFKRRSIAGSLVGGLPETQEMLDFCAQKGITADVEVIKMQDIDRAYERMLKGDVRYRFSIDLASLR